METYEEEREWLMKRYGIDQETADKMLAVLGHDLPDTGDDDETTVINNG